MRWSCCLVTFALVAIGCSTPLPEWEEPGESGDDRFSEPVVGTVVGVEPGDEDPEASEQTPGSLLTIEDIRAESERAYVLAELVDEPLQFIDRGDRFADFPTHLLGAQLIRTANQDADASPGADEFLRFWISTDAVVYVAHDRRIQGTPNWLASWAPSGEAMRSDEAGTMRVFDLYSREFAPGEIVLGSNVAAPEDYSMYSVVVTPK